MATIIIYACDTKNNSSLCGPETVSRCKKALSFIKRNDLKNCKIVLGSGVNPRYPNSAPFKETMALFLIDLLSQEKIEADIILSHTNAWGTAEETKSILKTNTNIEDIYIFSSWYHLPRIKIMWRYLTDKNIKTMPCFYLGNYHLPLLEPLKILAFLLFRK